MQIFYLHRPIQDKGLPQFFQKHGLSPTANQEKAAFTSEIDLTVDSCYEGYFNYPNMNLHSGTTTDCGAYYHFGTPLCDEKMSTTEKSVPNGKEVTIYKVRVGSEWYYCSKDTYDELNIGDEMNEYTFTGQGYSYVY